VSRALQNSRLAPKADGLCGISPLVVPVVPHEGESLRGYLFRLSSENRYPVSWLYELEPGLRRIFNSKEAVAAAARLADLSSTEQKCLLNPYGLERLTDVFLSAAPRFCPDCLKEGGYLDAIWDVAFACACPKHKVLLVDTCQVCHSRLAWRRPSLSQCSCGADLTKMVSTAAGEKVLSLNAMLWRAAGRVTPPFESSGLPESNLSKLSLKQLCTLFRFLAASGLGNVKQNKMKPSSIAMAVSAMEVVDSLLADWPGGFHRLLEEKCQKGEGLQQAFGSLYRNLYKLFSGAKFFFLRKAFENFLKDNWEGVIDGKYRRFNRLKSSTTSMSTRKASEGLGIGHRRLIKFVQMGVIKASQNLRPSGRKLTLISEADLRRFAKIFPYLVHGRKALVLLGISKKHLSVFVETGLLRTVAKPGAGSVAQWMFDSREVAKLLKKYQAIVPSCEPPAGAVPFSRVCQAYLPSKKSLPAFLDAVQTGTLPVAGIRSDEEFNLGALYFSPESIAEFRARVQGRERGTCSIPECAVRLGVKQEVAYHLVNRGLIASISTGGEKFTGRLIPKENIKAFESEYISLANIAVSQGASMRGAHLWILKKKISEAGISPMTGPDVDGCRQLFYRRSDLNTLAEDSYGA